VKRPPIAENNTKHSLYPNHLRVETSIFPYVLISCIGYSDTIRSSEHINVFVFTKVIPSRSQVNLTLSSILFAAAFARSQRLTRFIATPFPKKALLLGVPFLLCRRQRRNLYSVGFCAAKTGGETPPVNFYKAGFIFPSLPFRVRRRARGWRRVFLRRRPPSSRYSLRSCG